ncbi:MAG: alpha/beta hydrolase [Lachnospiraceae bacterium]|nr:alpha/beta hydrolase [Lachnospiraceae bacterium]
MGNNKPVDLDQHQSLKDIFHKNKYELDTRFVINDGAKHKCAIVCPGGGYSLVCSFIEGTPIARRLNDMGISVVIVYYRVKGKAKFPNPQDDLAQAIREVHDRAEELNLDMDNYSIWGASAGGHLVASMGTDNMGYMTYNLPKPGCLVLMYPVISMDKAITHVGTHNNLLGRDCGVEQEEFASVNLHVTADYPPTYIWCGDADTTVPPANTKLMAEALKEASVPAMCEIFKGVNHGVGPATGTSASEWINHAVDFWKSL